VRDRLVHRRTAVINQIRGFLLERGLSFAEGPANLRNRIPAILEDAEQNITPRMRMLLDRYGRSGSGWRMTSPLSATRSNASPTKMKPASAGDSQDVYDTRLTKTFDYPKDMFWCAHARSEPLTEFWRIRSAHMGRGNEC
jgi:hypothetical protein